MVIIPKWCFEELTNGSKICFWIQEFERLSLGRIKYQTIGLSFKFSLYAIAASDLENKILDVHVKTEP